MYHILPPNDYSQQYDVSIYKMAVSPLYLNGLHIKWIYMQYDYFMVMLKDLHHECATDICSISVIC